MRDDVEILVGMSDQELEALADSLLAPAPQTRLDELLERNAEQKLTSDEQAELDQLLSKVDHLTVLKCRIRRIADTDSGRSRTLIPDQRGQRFRGIADTDSGAIWTVIPG